MENSNIKPVRSDKVRDYIIDLTVEQIKVEEDIVRKVVDFQWDSAAEAIKNNFHIELNGFGRFAISYNKLNTRLRKLTYLIKGFEEAEKNKEEQPKKYQHFLSRQESIQKEHAFLTARKNEKEERDRKKAEYAEKNKDKILKQRIRQQKPKVCLENLENTSN